MSVLNSAKKVSRLKSVLVALGAALAIVLVFGVGFFVGRQSTFPLRAFPNSAQARNRSGHGAIGTIQSIDGQRITIQTRDGKIQVVRMDENTRLEKKFQKASLADFKINDQVVAIGSPNAEGEIQARLVGIVDPSFRPPRPSPNWNDPK
jgi:hypothetical protein